MGVIPSRYLRLSRLWCLPGRFRILCIKRSSYNVGGLTPDLIGEHTRAVEGVCGRQQAVGYIACVASRHDDGAGRLI